MLILLNGIPPFFFGECKECEETAKHAVFPPNRINIRGLMMDQFGYWKVTPPTSLWNSNQCTQ